MVNDKSQMVSREDRPWHPDTKKDGMESLLSRAPLFSVSSMTSVVEGE